MYYNAHALGSLSLEVNDKRLDLKFIGTDGSVSDYFTIQKYVPSATLLLFPLPHPQWRFFLPLQTLSLEARLPIATEPLMKLLFY